MPYLYLFCAFALNATANILVKLGAARGFDFSTFSPIPLLVSNWQFVLGLFLFALNVIFYFLALRSLSISVAYPIMIVMSFIIINGFAFFILGERVLPLQLCGYAPTIAGLFLVVRFA